MKINCTSIEQSKTLMSKGLDPESADMHWSKEDDVEDSEMPIILDGYRLNCGNNPVVNINGFSFRYGYIVPSWSIGRLLEIIPGEIKIRSIFYHLRIDRVGGGAWMCSYNIWNDEIFTHCHEGLMECLVRMIRDLIDAGHITKTKSNNDENIR